MIQLVVYMLLSAKRRAYFCISVSAIEMGGVSQYFSKVLGSAVDLTLLNIVVGENIAEILDI